MVLHRVVFFWPSQLCWQSSRTWRKSSWFLSQSSRFWAQSSRFLQSSQFITIESILVAIESILSTIESILEPHTTQFSDQQFWNKRLAIKPKHVSSYGMINWKRGRPVNKISNFYSGLKNLVEENSNSHQQLIFPSWLVCAQGGRTSSRALSNLMM